MKIDLSLTIVSILALCGIISPIIVAIINNRHNERMKKLDFKHNVFTEIFKEFTLKYHELFIQSNATNAAEFQMSAIRLAVVCDNMKLRNTLIYLGNLAMKNQARTPESDEIFESCVKQIFHEV